MKKLIALLLTLFWAGSTLQASIVWQNEWNCDAFPESFNSGAVFTSGGAGSRHLIDSLGNYGDPGNVSPNYDAAGNHFYFVNADHPSDTGAYGYYFDTKASAWTNADSTIEFSLSIDAYYDNKVDVLGVTVLGNNKFYGFSWGRSGTTGLTHRIKSVESSANYINFDNFQKFKTFRVLYFAQGSYAELYTLNNNTWEYLLTSNGTALTSAAKLRIGDYSSSMAGRWQIDYVKWTNQVAEVPEPATIAFLSLGSATLLYRRK